MTNSEIVKSLLQPQPNSSSYFILPVETLGMSAKSLNFTLNLSMVIQRNADDSNNAHATIILDTELEIQRISGLFVHNCPQSFIVPTPSMRYRYSFIWISIIKMFLLSFKTYVILFLYGRGERIQFLYVISRNMIDHFNVGNSSCVNVNQNNPDILNRATVVNLQLCLQ